MNTINSFHFHEYLRKELIYKSMFFRPTNQFLDLASEINKKAKYLVNARSCFNKNILDSEDAFKIRDRLVKDIKGLGHKEASHFLRNIGLGRDIAILDRHILKNLRKYRAIDNIPSSLTPKTYLEIENKAREFSKKVKIPLEELDLLFWSKETGEIFK